MHPLPIFDMRGDVYFRNFLSLLLAILANISDVKSKHVKIIGGQDATHGQFPYQVGLLRKYPSVANSNVFLLKIAKVGNTD